MTTIVYRDGILAADRFCTTSERIHPAPVCKLFAGTLNGGRRLMAGTGDWHIVYAEITKMLATGGETAETGSESVILDIRPGEAWTYDGSRRAPLSLVPFVAYGSGAKVALGALYQGATAVQAVEIAAKVDPYTGGGVDWLSLEEKPPQPHEMMRPWQ